jgi:hypothetical protein
VETISIRIVKEWDDGGTSVDHSGDSITARLYADTVEVRSVTLNAANNWEQTITGLPKYVSGTSQEIVYTVSEDSVAHYTMSVAELDGTERIWVPTMSLSDDTEYIILTSRSTGTIMGMTANDDGVAWTSTNSANPFRLQTAPRCLAACSTTATSPTRRRSCIRDDLAGQLGGAENRQPGGHA